MTRILGVVLLLAGGWLVFTGHNRAGSVAGKAQTNIAELKSEIDGKTRVPEHFWYYAGGAVLVLAGGWIVMRKS